MPLGKILGKSCQNRSTKNIRCGWYENRHRFL